jgi:hypothetical protein
MYAGVTEANIESRARVAVTLLAIVRHICAHGATLATKASDTGLLDASRTLLLSSRWQAVDFVPSEGELAQTVEGLRLWQICVCVGAADAFGPAEGIFPCALCVARLAEVAVATGVDEACTYVPGAPVQARMSQAAAAVDANLPSMLKRPTEGGQDGGQGTKDDEDGEGGGGGVEPEWLPGSEATARHDALCLVAMQALCMLLVTLLRASFLPQAGSLVWLGHLPAYGAHIRRLSSVSLGFAQQLYPLASGFLAACSPCSPPASTSAAATLLPPQWPMLDLWSSLLAAAAEAAAPPTEVVSTDAVRPLPRPPRAQHASQLLPAWVLAEGARGAAVLLTAELAIARPGLVSGIIADRSTALAVLLPLCPFPAPLLRPTASPLFAAVTVPARTQLELATASLHTAAAAALSSTTPGTATPLTATLVNMPRLASNLLERACHAAEGLLIAAVRLHCTKQGTPRRLCTSAAWEATRVHTAQLQAVSFLRLLQAWMDLSGFTAGEGKCPGMPQRSSELLGRGALSNDQHRVLTRALLAAPVAGGSESAVAMQALQLLFDVRIAAPLFAAGREMCARFEAEHPVMAAEATGGGSEVGTVAAASLVSAHSVHSACRLLMHAYGTAWAGSELAAMAVNATAQPLDSGELPLDLPMQWRTPLGPEGQRLPAPPDWFAVAIALPRGCNGVTNEGAVRGETAAATVLAAAVQWICGLYAGGVLHGAAQGQAEGQGPVGREELCPLYFSRDPALSRHDVRPSEDCLHCPKIVSIVMQHPLLCVSGGSMHPPLLNVLALVMSQGGGMSQRAPVPQRVMLCDDNIF